MSLRAAFLLLPLTLATTALPARADAFDPALFREMHWRNIGPHRGGRTKAAAGIPDRPNVFYVGAVNGGVWKTDDYGRTWHPIFDDQPTGSIGAIAIAPSRPEVIYVGSGEGLQRPDLSTGDGIYKSTDGGATWQHLGLRSARQIPQIAVDPKDPDRLFVAVLGSPYGAGPERGIFRSTDGGATFERVLYRDEDTGAVDVVLDPHDPQTVYAVLWEERLAPWENGVFNGPGSGAYKSTDGGTTWRPLTKGLPTFAADGLGRIGLTVAPSDSRRLYATVEAKTRSGLYRSDDAGESWTLVNGDERYTGRASDFAEVKVHPANPDVVFTASVVTWKSTDGGKTFTGFRGAPGGDDYHRIWINPKNPDVMLIASDQGVIVTVNGGASWSSWYNQPTAQFYHVSTDNAFPYRVCGGQQESGSACVQSRSDDGRITFREWHPVSAEEYGYVAADPLDPEVVYGGRITRYDRRTHQAQTVTPKPLKDDGYRVVRTAPVLFSPTDPHTLYFASERLWKTTDGAQHWTAISPDLTRKTWEAPANVGKYRGTEAAKATQRGVVYAIAPSPVDGARIWAGTDDGLIHVTSDGGAHWTDVTPPELGPWSKVSMLEASHFDRDTAYAAINTFRLDDLRPHVYRTRDAGRTWQHVSAGMPDGGIVNTVREDPVRRGLLFAGTEQAVYVSFDDGEAWQSLRIDMPATSIRDLVIKDDDLVLGTHGRGFWILDDITPLRQLTASTLQAPVVLLRPQDAWRWRWSSYPDTPLPPDEPSGENPPDGAIVDYWLKSDAQGPVQLEVLDAAGIVVRRFASDDPPEPPVEKRNIPDYWIRPPQTLGTRAGLHRFVWDLHYPRPRASEFAYPISAIPANTPAEPRGPWAVPGAYTLRLTVGGQRLEQPLRVKLDPRVTSSLDALRAQFARTSEVAADMARVADARQGASRAPGTGTDVAQGTAPPKGSPTRRVVPATEPGAREKTLADLHEKLTTLYGFLQEADAAPTAAALEAWTALHARVEAALGGRR
jgi:photosystem II stability/assembly factor-like uncharacterized protein